MARSRCSDEHSGSEDNSQTRTQADHHNRAGDIAIGTIWYSVARITAGLNFDILPNRVALALDYRIKGAKGFGFPGSVAGKFMNNFDYQTRSVFVSIRYSFGS